MKVLIGLGIFVTAIAALAFAKDALLRGFEGACDWAELQLALAAQDRMFWPRLCVWGCALVAAGVALLYVVPTL